MERQLPVQLRSGWETKGMHMLCSNLRLISFLKQLGWVGPEEGKGWMVSVWWFGVRASERSRSVYTSTNDIATGKIYLKEFL